MARPPLPIGTHGKIRTTQTHDGTWRAIANFRDTDGKTRPVERGGTTRTKAENALRLALDERSGTATVTLKPSHKFRTAADVWETKVLARRAQTTIEKQSDYLHRVILPGIGDLRLRECAPGRLDDFLDALEPRYSPNTRRMIRSTISGVLDVAVRHRALDRNPVRDVTRIEGKRKRPQAIRAQTIKHLLDHVDTDRYAKLADVPAVLRFFIATGCRVGEIAGMRWCDINLGTDTWRTVVEDVTYIVPPNHLLVSGNIVYTAKYGLMRNEGKTFDARRVIALPGFLSTLLQVRRNELDDDTDPVFPARDGGWRYPGHIGRSVKKAAARAKATAEDHGLDVADLDDVITHKFRKSVATALDEGGQNARIIANQLGHAHVSMTQDVYLGRGGASTAAAEVLDRTYGPGE